jgi:serine/threonine protein kinase
MKVCNKCGACFEDAYDLCSFDGGALDAPFEGKRVLGDRYLLEQRVAEGAMGVVFRATHLQVGSTVAVKLMRPQRDGLRIGMQRFWREAQILGQIKHPNAVLVIDFGVEERAPSPFPYLVTEFLRGQPLSDVLQAHGRMTLAEAAQVVGPLCEAVEEAHEAGVIHRDIKPSNVFLERLRDDSEVVKVLDFGIAKFVELDAELLERKRKERAEWAMAYAPDERDLLDEVAAVRANEAPTAPARLRSLASAEGEAASEGTITEAGFMIGTIPYMAPEQMTGEEVSRRTDVYAVATLLFRLLAGRLPYEGTDDEIIAGKVSGDVPSLRELGVEVPASLDEVVVHALALEPNDRPARVLELADALTQAMRLEEEREPDARELAVRLGAAAAAFTPLVVAMEAFAQTEGDADAYANARDRILSLLSPLAEAAQQADRLPTRLDADEREPLARLSDDLAGAADRAGAALRQSATLHGEAKERADYLRALFGRLQASTTLLCAELDDRVEETSAPPPAPAASVFDDTSLDDTDLGELVRPLLSGDELISSEAFDELLSGHAGLVIDHLRREPEPTTDDLVRGLWRFADALLLRELYPVRGHQTVRLLPALRRYKGDAATPFRDLAALFARPAEGEAALDDSALDAELGRASAADRPILLRALLVHPVERARQRALRDLRPADVWQAVAFAQTPIDVLRAIFERVAERAGDEYLKVFFLCCYDRLLLATGAELDDAFRLLERFLWVDCFSEDVVFDRLIDLDTTLRERALEVGASIPGEAAYVARATEFARAGAVESQTPDNFRDVPLPVQRLLARKGLFLSYFVSHANERVAKETLPHLFKKEDVTRYLRVPTIHRAVIVGLSRKRRLLRKEAPRLALLHNPRTPAHAARPFVPLLSVEQLRQLSSDKAANAEVRGLATTFLSRLKHRRGQ